MHKTYDQRTPKQRRDAKRQLWANIALVQVKARKTRVVTREENRVKRLLSRAGVAMVTGVAEPTEDELFR